LLIEFTDGSKVTKLPTASSVFSNFLPVLKYPEALQRIRIESSIEPLKIRTALRFAESVQYQFVGNEIFFLGAAETVRSHLKANNISVQLEEPLGFKLQDHFDILRIVLYKAFRYFAQRKGFAWKPHRQTVLFASNIDGNEQQRIKNEFGFQFIHVLNGYQQAVMHAHEGFVFKLELIGEDLFMVVLPNVTPLLGIAPHQLHPGMNIAPACHKWDCEVRASCRLVQKKISIQSFEIVKERPWWCPYAEATIVAKDASGKTCKLPAHTVNLEANSVTIRKAGVYRGFREVSLKNNLLRLQALRAILSYLGGGSSRIAIPVGDEPDGFQIDCELKQLKAEVQPDAWKSVVVA
jgi:hypothetical protein